MEIEQVMNVDLGPNLTWGLLEMLGRSIIRGDYHDRPFPTEAEIVRRHQVSRSVTREATKMLAAKGLVGARPKEGTFVRPTDAWNLLDYDVLRWLFEKPHGLTLLRQLGELRAGIEPQAAALAAARSSNEQLLAITSAYERLVFAKFEKDDLLNAQLDFHAAILLGSNNPFLSQLHVLATSALQVARHRQGASVRMDVAHYSSVHEAIRRRDPDIARTAMTALITSTEEPR